MATTKKSVAKKTTKPATKSVAKKTAKLATKKEVVVKKPAVKKTTKPVAKKETTKKVAPVKNATNKALDSMLAKIEKAKKSNKTSVVVYTTKKTDYDIKPDSDGFAIQSNDLKPNLFEAYHYLSCKFGKNLKIEFVEPSEAKVDWIIIL